MLGLGKAKVSECALGDEHSLCVTETGEVYGWGEGSFCGVNLGGPLAAPVKLAHHSKFSKVAAGTQHSLLLDTKGKVYGTGSNLEG